MSYPAPLFILNRQFLIASRFLDGSSAAPSPPGTAATEARPSDPPPAAAAPRMLRGGRAGQSAAAVSSQGLTINVQFAIKLSGPFRAAFGGPEAARPTGGMNVWESPDLFHDKCKALEEELKKVGPGPHKHI